MGTVAEMTRWEVLDMALGEARVEWGHTRGLGCYYAPQIHTLKS